MNRLMNSIWAHAGKTGLILIITTSTALAQLSGKGFVFDASLSGANCQFNDDQIFKQTIVDLDLREHPKRGCNFRAAVCGADKVIDIKKATLSEIETRYYSSTTRRKELGKFLTDMKAGLQHLAFAECNQSETNLYRTICAMRESFISQEDEIDLYIFTDGIIASSVYSFHQSQYKSNPQRILDDYEKIKAAFAKDIPIPDFSGVSITFISSDKTNELSLFALRFWKKFLLEAGAKSVESKASF